MFNRIAAGTAALILLAGTARAGILYNCNRSGEIPILVEVAATDTTWPFDGAHAVVLGQPNSISFYLPPAAQTVSTACQYVNGTATGDLTNFPNQPLYVGATLHFFDFYRGLAVGNHPIQVPAWATLSPGTRYTQVKQIDNGPCWAADAASVIHYYLKVCLAP